MQQLEGRYSPDMHVHTLSVQMLLYLQMYINNLSKLVVWGRDNENATSVFHSDVCRFCFHLALLSQDLLPPLDPKDIFRQALKQYKITVIS